MNRKGILVVLSGFSGVGKGTIMRCLTERYGHYSLSISATTRQPREGEEDGREYFFKSKEEFETLIKENRLIEYACYCDNYYGTPRDYVEDQMEQGRDVILEIELQGALKIREQYPEALLLFVMPPDAQTLADRLRGRGTETEDKIRKRLEKTFKEIPLAEKYDYIVFNPDGCSREAADDIFAIVRAEKHKSGRIADIPKLYFGN